MNWASSEGKIWIHRDETCQAKAWQQDTQKAGRLDGLKKRVCQEELW